MANKTEVKTYLKYAKIANAAYAFELIYSHEDNDKYFGKLDKVLTDTRSFSTSEAKEFVKTYWSDDEFKKQVQTSYQYFKTKYDNGSPEGFKAALLKSKDGYVLAIAGTDPDIGDIGSDYNLAEGVVSDQFKYLVEYINYLKKDVLPNDAKITVAGHSLGGALTQLATATFPDLIEHAYTYNSPGGLKAPGIPLEIPLLTVKDGKYFIETITDDGYPIYTEISKELYDAYHSYKNNALNNLPVTNIRGLAEYGTGITDLGADIGSKDIPFFINTEIAAVNVYAHSINTLEKSIYFQNILMSIDPSLDSNTINKELSSFDSVEERVNLQGLDFFDRWLNRIDNIFEGAVSYKKNQADGRSIADFAIEFENTKYDKFKNHTFTFLHDKSISYLDNKTKSNIYALTHVNPFKIDGDLPAYNENFDGKIDFDKYILKCA